MCESTNVKLTAALVVACTSYAADIRNRFPSGVSLIVVNNHKKISLVRRRGSILTFHLWQQQYSNSKYSTVYKHYFKLITSCEHNCSKVSNSNSNKPQYHLSTFNRSYHTQVLQKQQEYSKNSKPHSTKPSSDIMGSANCKEYTTTSKKIDRALTAQQDGTYQSTSECDMSDYTAPVEICNVNDLQENTMRQFDFDQNTKVLVVKQRGQLTVIGNKCPHYGAPLNTGVLGLGRVRCPWHGATFDIRTGDIEDFPGLDSLPCFMVHLENDGKVKVRGKTIDVEKNKRLKDMVKRDKLNKHCIVVVGGGPASGVCVETLRQEGFDGRIVMISSEQYLPYDRVKVTKAIDTPITQLQFRDSGFYDQYGIEVILGVEVTKVDTVAKRVVCSNKITVKYDHLFIATGLSPRRLSINGIDLKNVFTVRKYDDGQAILAAITPETQLVLLGSSFIVMELASSLLNKVKSVTIIYRSTYPFVQFGDAVGREFYHLYKEKGITMLGNTTITDIYSSNEESVSEVETDDGSRIPCDVLVLGIGSTYNTDFLHGSGIKINPDGSIDTDMHLMTNVIDVYVGGDIAKAPVLSNANQRASIGHYQLAQYHGRVAALNMCGVIEDLRAVPFFFSMAFGKGIRYAGYGEYADVLIKGNLEEFKFIAYYLDSHDNVVAVMTIGHDPVAAQFAELQNQGKRLHRKSIENSSDPLEWTNMVKEKKARVVCQC